MASSNTSVASPHDAGRLRFYNSNPLESGENLEKYKENGLHPVEIDERYDHGSYRILHKLGSGGSSTVWVAHNTHDNHLYALKFLSSNASRTSQEAIKMQQLDRLSSVKSYIPQLVHSFEFAGPNSALGKVNRVLVLNLLGPSIWHLSYESTRLHPGVVQVVMLKVAKTLVELHKANIVHRDLTPRNVLLKINPRVSKLSPGLLYENFGRPYGVDVTRNDGQDPQPHAPRKSYMSIDFTKVPKWLVPSPILIDFGESADPRRVKSRLRTIPPMYAAPEAIFENKVDLSCDIWSLGCVIFKARAGYDLFPGDQWERDQVCAVAYDIIFRLGCPPPFELWKAAEFDGHGGVILPHTYELRNRFKQRKTWIETTECENFLPLKDLVRKIRDRPTEAKSNDLFWKFGGNEGRCVIYTKDEAKFPYISSKEADLLYDLLSKIFVWDPAKRISAAEVVKHPWFRFHNQ